MFRGLFLDRDGVIIEHRSDYVRSWSDVCFYPQALRALALLKNTPIKIVVVSNQAGIGRGLINPEAAHEINRRLVEEIRDTGGRVDGVYICPHRPDENCVCRKPKPGLILRAAEDNSIDLSRSILIGDNLTDLLAGQAAGIGKLALVRTGIGEEQTKHPLPDGMPAFDVFADLSQALQVMIHEQSI